MHLLVLPQFRWVAEGLPTLVTHVGRSSRVALPVTNQGHVLLGGISTFGATEGSLLTVSYQVVEEREGLREGFPAAAAPDSLLLATGAGWQGLPEPRAPA